MTFGLSGAALAGIAVGGATLISNGIASNAAQDAADAQNDAARAAQTEQQKRFEAIQKLLQPYVDTGTSAIGAQKDLIGLGGQEAQSKAINALQTSPQFGALQQQGENAILQNAAATGGLRGGNTQGALAQFRPQLLNQLIQQQYQNLGGLSSIGQNAAAGVGNAGMTTGNNISNLITQAGAAQAGGILGEAKGNAGMLSSIASGLGAFSGLGGMF
jgi:hypothetical protein